MSSAHQDELPWLTHAERLTYEGHPVVVRWGSLTQSGVSSGGTPDVGQFLSGQLLFDDGRRRAVLLPRRWGDMDTAARQACIEGCRVL